MTSSTLYREGDDLDTLLAELSDEYAGQVRVLGVEQTRVSGMRGLFGKPRVAVRYVVESEAASGAPVAVSSAPAADPLAELIANAETAEAVGPARVARVSAAPRVADVESATLASVGSNAEFASLLLELAAQKKASVEPAPSRRPAPRPRAVSAAAAPAPATAASVPVPRPVAPEPTAPAPAPAAPMPTPGAPFAAASPPSVAPAPAPPADVRMIAEPVTHDEPAAIRNEEVAERAPRNAGLVLRRELAELGVPIHLVPNDADDVADAVQTIVRRLPTPPRPPAGVGRVLAIVGPATQAVAAARRLRDAQPGDVEATWTIGVPRGLARGTTLLQDPWAAAGIADTHRERAGRLAIAVVATDAVDEPARTSSRALRALRPDAVWAVVDATRKPADSRKRVAGIDLVDALVVVGAAETASPATVLELDLPVAMLDGHAATPERWAAALLDSAGGLGGAEA